MGVHTPGNPRAGSSQSAIAKATAVMEAVTYCDKLAAISEATALAPSTTHRILGELVDLGWVHQHDHVYSPGARMLSLAQHIDVNRALTDIALQPLRSLRDRTGFTVHFAVLRGDAAVYLLKLEGRRAYLMRSRVGDALSLHCSAIGKAALARMPDNQIVELLSRVGLPAATDVTITDMDSLLDHLRLVRHRGWALDDGENEEHTRCVGAAVTDRNGNPVGGVSLSALDFDLSLDDARRYAQLVLRVAESISAQLAR